MQEAHCQQKRATTADTTAAPEKVTTSPSKPSAESPQRCGDRVLREIQASQLRKRKVVDEAEDSEGRADGTAGKDLL